MKSRSHLTAHLRDQIVGALHLGQMRSGDRLPSIRELADQFGKNPRTVKAAYAALAREGLVEVRGRSGVYVARQEVLAGEIPEEMANWLSGVVADAWQRNVALPALPGLFERASRSARVRCALVEEVTDTIVAVRHELEVDWELDVTVVAPDSADRVSGVDFFLATSFCAPAAHAAAELCGKPFILLTIHSALQQAIHARLRTGRLTVVAVDPRFGERMRIAYIGDAASKYRFILAEDIEAIARLDPDDRVLLTRAAHQRLGSLNVGLIHPHSPTLSTETARDLATIVVRKNLNARM